MERQLKVEEGANRFGEMAGLSSCPIVCTTHAVISQSRTHSIIHHCLSSSDVSLKLTIFVRDAKIDVKQQSLSLHAETHHYSYTCPLVFDPPTVITSSRIQRSRHKIPYCDSLSSLISNAAPASACGGHSIPKAGNLSSSGAVGGVG